MTRGYPQGVLPKKSARHKPGRKGVYDDTMPNRAFKLALAGLTDKEIAYALGISEKTMDMWKSTHVEFKEAIHKGGNNAIGNVVEAMYQKAIGYSHADTVVQLYKGKPVIVPVRKYYPPDSTAAIFFLKNRSRGNDNPWIDAQRLENTTTGARALQLKNLKEVDLSKFSDDEVEFLLNLSKNLQVKEK